MHSDSPAGGLMPLLAALVLVLVLGRLGGSLAARFRQPAVLGELVAGIAIGNLGLAGVHGIDSLRTLPGIDLLAQIGVLFLLFSVGIESDLGRRMRVGGSSFAVATLGVIAPMALGWWVTRAFFPGQNPLVYAFAGATLCATSVGLTARVLADLGRTASAEGRVILGAAVIDDVLGLVVLAVVSGLIKAADAGAPFDAASVGWIVARAALFLAAALVAGRWVSRHALALAARLPGEAAVLPLALAFCFALAWLAGRAGLAPIVGAFAAGLVLDEVQLVDLGARDPRRRSLDELLEPISGFLVPIFFVAVGMRVDLAA